MSPESNGTVTQLVRFGRGAASIFLTHTHANAHTTNNTERQAKKFRQRRAHAHTHTSPTCTPKQTPFHSTTHARLYLPRSYCTGASSPALFFPLCFTLHYPPIHLQCAVISPSISSPSQSSPAMGLCPFIIHGVVLMAQAAMSDVNLCASKAHSASTRLGREGYRSSCRAQVPYSTKSTRSITPGSHSKCKFSAPLSAAADSSTFFMKTIRSPLMRPTTGNSVLPFVKLQGNRSVELRLIDLTQWINAEVTTKCVVHSKTDQFYESVNPT